MDNDDYLEFAKEVIDLYEKGDIGKMGELINSVRLKAKKDPSATSPAAMPGYVLCPKPPSVIISEIKLYRPENDIAFHNELMELLDKYVDEYKMDWDVERSI